MEFINIKFPLENLTDDFIFRSDTTTKQVVRSHVLLLLLTEKGERFYKPSYGTNLRQFFFQPNDQITERDIENDIRETFERFMPNITIKSIDFRQDIADTQPNAILLTITFNYTEDYLSFDDSVSIKYEDFQ